MIRIVPAVDRIGFEGNPRIGSRILRYGFDEEEEILGNRIDS